MYELVQVSDTCFYIQSPAKIGLVLTGEQEVYLIDSGNDKDAGKKVKKIFERFELTMTFEQHALVGSTVRSYLTWLKEQGRLQTAFEDNMLVWSSTSA